MSIIGFIAKDKETTEKLTDNQKEALSMTEVITDMSEDDQTELIKIFLRLNRVPSKMKHLHQLLEKCKDDDDEDSIMNLISETLDTTNEAMTIQAESITDLLRFIVKKEEEKTTKVYMFDPNQIVSIPPGADVRVEHHSSVDHPAHYGSGPYETINVIEAWGLGFNLGNAVKYISRAGKKDPQKTVEDLEKAVWYINREISNLKEED